MDASERRLRLCSGHFETQSQVGFGVLYRPILMLGLGSYCNPDSGWVLGNIDAQTQVRVGVLLRPRLRLGSGSH